MCGSTRLYGYVPEFSDSLLEENIWIQIEKLLSKYLFEGVSLLLVYAGGAAVERENTARGREGEGARARVFSDHAPPPPLISLLFSSSP